MLVLALVALQVCNDHVRVETIANQLRTVFATILNSCENCEIVVKQRCVYKYNITVSLVTLRNCNEHKRRAVLRAIRICN